MAKRKFKFGDIVQLEWRDAAGHTGWLHADDLAEDGAMFTTSTGTFVKESKHGIYTAGMVNVRKSLNDVSFVPRGMITKTTLIRRRQKGKK
jgi:hypothetical protein